MITRKGNQGLNTGGHSFAD